MINYNRMIEIKKNLQEFVLENGVGPDFHEPDNYEVSAIITGNHLDNAFGSDQEGLPEEVQEFVVHLKSEFSGDVVSVNLADLLAIANL